MALSTHRYSAWKSFFLRENHSACWFRIWTPWSWFTAAWSDRALTGSVSMTFSPPSFASCFSCLFPLSTVYRSLQQKQSGWKTVGGRKAEREGVAWGAERGGEGILIRFGPYHSDNGARAYWVKHEGDKKIAADRCDFRLLLSSNHHVTFALSISFTFTKRYPLVKIAWSI